MVSRPSNTRRLKVKLEVRFEVVAVAAIAAAGPIVLMLLQW